MAIVQKSAFLEFRITDRTQALDKALPAMDRVLQRLGVKASAGAAEATPSAVTQLLQGDSTKGTRRRRTPCRSWAACSPV